MKKRKRREEANVPISQTLNNFINQLSTSLEYIEQNIYIYIFWQVIKDLFHKKDIMFTMVNTQNLNWIQVP